MPETGASWWGTGLRLASYLRPYVAILLVVLACSLAYAGARAARAYLVKPLLDDVLLADESTEPTRMGWLPDFLPNPLRSEAEPEPVPADTAEADTERRYSTAALENFTAVVWAGLLVVLIIPFAHFGQTYLVRYVLGRVLVDLQQDLCRQLLRLPLAFHQRVTRGERLSRTTNDATRAHLALELMFGDVVQGALAVLVGGAVLLSISWQLTLLILLTAPVITGVIAFYGRRIRREARRRQESFGDVTQRLVEILSSVKVIKAFRAQEAEARSFASHNRRLFRRSMKVVLNRALSRTVVEGLNNAVGVGILILGAFLVYRQMWGLTPGSLAAFVAVMGSVYRPVKDLTKGWNGFMDSIPAADRFFELLDEPGEPPDPPGAVVLSDVAEGFRVRGVSFAYEREQVLRDVSFDVAAGDVVAIVGRTGSGKTTLADLLVRFYDPDSGTIEIDGTDLRQIARDSLMQRVAVVTQEPLLFEGSIRDNIRYGRPDATPAEIEAAAHTAHVDEFSSRLPDGLDTEVGEAGMQLSGGQRQRVTIARAILRNPAILVFDEATSALDAQSERYVQDAMEGLLEGRTVFVIAHRLSTIRHADRILVLDEGRIVASGTHEELVGRGGLYRELVELQTSADVPS